MPRQKKVKPITLTGGPALTEKILIQYDGGEWDVAVLKETAIAAYVEAGHQRGRISKLSVYLKPDERKVYYVVNDKISGSADF